jgi:hypothetical protein
MLTCGPISLRLHRKPTLQSRRTVSSFAKTVLQDSIDVWTIAVCLALVTISLLVVGGVTRRRSIPVEAFE